MAAVGPGGWAALEDGPQAQDEVENVGCEGIDRLSPVLQDSGPRMGPSFCKGEVAALSGVLGAAAATQQT